MPCLDSCMIQWFNSSGVYAVIMIQCRYSCVNATIVAIILPKLLSPVRLRKQYFNLLYIKCKISLEPIIILIVPVETVCSF